MSRASTLACGVLSALLLTGALQAQPRERNEDGGIFRMEINNGTMRSVHYFSTDLSAGDRSTLKEMERLENEAIYAGDLLALRRQYVTDELRLQPYRTYVQNLLYGANIDESSYGSFGGGGWGYPGLWVGGGPVAPVFGGGFYGSGWGGYGGGFGGGVSANFSLANGIGDEGRIKAAMAPVVAQQATPEYVASLQQAYDRVAYRASASPALRLAFGLPAERRKPTPGIGTARALDDAGVTLTLKNGNLVQGTKMTEKDGWFIVEVPNGKIRVRQSEVMRVDEPTKVRGAEDDGR